LELENEKEVFYNDQQGCVTWALETSTGRVYLYNSDNPYKIQYVAKSLPEFLMRIYTENEIWYNALPPPISEVYKIKFAISFFP